MSVGYLPTTGQSFCKVKEIQKSVHLPVTALTADAQRGSEEKYLAAGMGLHNFQHNRNLTTP